MYAYIWQSFSFRTISDIQIRSEIYILIAKDLNILTRSTAFPKQFHVFILYNK